MGEGFGANPLFSLSYFYLKLTDKPEFTIPFSKFFGVQNLFFKKGFASPRSPSPTNSIIFYILLTSE